VIRHERKILPPFVKNAGLKTQSGVKNVKLTVQPDFDRVDFSLDTI